MKYLLEPLNQFHNYRSEVYAVGGNIIGAPKMQNKLRFFKYCDSIIGLLSFAPCKVSNLSIIFFICDISSLLLFLITLYSIVVAIVGKAITIYLIREQ